MRDEKERGRDIIIDEERGMHKIREDERGRCIVIPLWGQGR